MRRLLFVTLVALAGCGKAKVSDAAVPAPAPADPVAARREDEAQAAFSLNTACESIAEALAQAKKLAPSAGGDAKEALLDVADMFDSAGATLADHTEPPVPLEQYRKQDSGEDRQKAVSDALDALHELRDARGTLDDLDQNVPADHAKALEAIEEKADDAIDDVTGAITRLGGKVPPEEDDNGDDHSSKDRS